MLVFAVLHPVPSINPVQLFDSTWLPIILAVVQVASLVFLVIYVVKTVQIARSNQASADASKRALEATLASVRISEQALQEMKAARDAQTAPYVVVYFDASDFLVRIVMENLGQSAARNIAIKFEPDLDVFLRPGGAGEWPNFVTTTTPNLAPKQRLICLVNSYPALVNNPKLSDRYVVTVTYTGGMSDLEQDAERKATFVLDLKSFYGMEVQRDTLMEKAIDKLGEVATKLEETKRAVGEIGDRLEIGLRVTEAHPSIGTSGSTNSNLEVCISLLESLQTRWSLVEKKNRAREYVLPSEETAVTYSLEQLNGLVPYLGLSDSLREQVLAAVSTLQGQVREHFRYGRDVEEKVLAAIAELLSILRPTQHGDILPSEHNIVNGPTANDNDQTPAPSDGSLQTAVATRVEAKAGQSLPKRRKRT